MNNKFNQDGKSGSELTDLDMDEEKIRELKRQHAEMKREELKRGEIKREEIKKKKLEENGFRSSRRHSTPNGPHTSKNTSIGNFLIPIFVLLLLTTVVAITFCVILLKDKSRETAPAETSSNTAEEIFYNQETVDRMVENAKEEGADARESEIKEYIRTQAEASSSNFGEVLRTIYDEYIIYNSGNAYTFVPIDSSIERNNFDASKLQIGEDGYYTYSDGADMNGHKMIDVSQHQGNIDWQQVADSGVEYVMIRVGYRGYGSGAMVQDEKFETNIEGAAAVGLKVGVYFFTQAVSEEEAKEEADFVLTAIKDHSIDGPVVLDIEKPDDSGARANGLTAMERTSLVKTFCDTVKAAGYQTMLYGNTYSFFAMLDISQLQEYDIWFAFYNSYLYYPYRIKAWQYSATGTVPGINGEVDLNLWFE